MNALADPSYRREQIHHLVGIYKLLFPVMERALTPDLFVRIRQLLYARPSFLSSRLTPLEAALLSDLAFCRIDMTTLVGRLQSRLTYTIDVTQRFTSQIERMDQAQAFASSRPASPRPPSSLPPSHPLSPSLTVDSATLGLSNPISGLEVPPWEAAFELQDIFSDWPFDFLSAPDAAQPGVAGEGQAVDKEAGASSEPWSWQL